MEQLRETIKQLEEKVNKLQNEYEWLHTVTTDEGAVIVPYIDFSEDGELMLPKRNKIGDIGYDCFAHETVTVPAHGSAKVSLGIGVIIPNGFGIACRTRGGRWLDGLLVGPAHVDLNYRGRINALLYNVTDEDIVIEKGERPCSLDIYKTYAIKWQPMEEFLRETGLTYDEVMDTNRGDTGFGNSGK